MPPPPSSSSSSTSPRTPTTRQRRRRPHASGPLLLLLVLLLALAVPAPAGAISWPFGWGSRGESQQQQQTSASSSSSVDACEAALLMGAAAAAGGEGAAASVEERVLSSSSSSSSSKGKGQQGQQQKMATFQARRKHTADVEVRTLTKSKSKSNNDGAAGAVNERLWHEYLQSEASKAPILNAQNWTQLGADTYRCEMAPIAFFSAQIVPVIDVTLEIDPRTRTAHIHARSGKVRKSDEPPSADAAADGYACTDCGQWNETSFTMKTKNTVTWAHLDDATLRLTSDLSMEVSFEKPAWVWVPNSMMNRVGSLVLRKVVTKALPEFLDRIIAGYHDWAATVETTAGGGGKGGRGTVV